MNRPKLVFWLDQPFRVSAGFSSYVAERWGNEVYQIYQHELSKERTQNGWELDDFSNFQMFNIGETDKSVETVAKFLKERELLDAIHVVNGCSSVGFQKYVRRIMKPLKNYKICLMSERPGYFGPKWKFLPRFLLNKYYSFRYRKRIRLFLPLGRLGVESFQKAGWIRDSMFNFMYCPLSRPLKIYTEPQWNRSKTVRFAYIGRFGRPTKGIDVLMKAVDRLKGSGWSLDLFGGYGEYANQTIRWANKKNNVFFQGKLPSSSVCERIDRDYDVVLIPSRFDGWNLLNNESLFAERGTITTDAAVSDECISASGAGVVVKHGSVKSFAKAMQDVIDHPEIINLWSERAKNYKEKISSQSVGEYFMSILDWKFGGVGDRPKCPWL